MEDFTCSEASPSSSKKRYYVALHHFHPAVVRAFYENPLTSAQKHKVPISITEHELDELGMDILQEDQILSISGMPTGGYYFVPSYPHEHAHDDLKTLIQAVRTSRQKKQAKGLSSSSGAAAAAAGSRSGSGSGSASKLHKQQQVPTDIQITQKVKEVTSDGFPVAESSSSSDKKPAAAEKLSSKEKMQPSSSIESSPTTTKTAAPVVDRPAAARPDFEFEANFDASPTAFEPFPTVAAGEDGLTTTSSTDDFDNLWKESPSSQEIVESSKNLFSETIFEEEEAGVGDDGNDDEKDTAEQKELSSSTTPSSATSLAAKRAGNRDRPWDAPKYRKERSSNEEQPKKVSGPAHYIDPNATGALSEKLASTAVAEEDNNGGDVVARAAAAPDTTVFRKPASEANEKKSVPAVSPAPSLDSHLSNKSTSSKPRRRFDFAEEDAYSVDSGDSAISGAIFLNHQLPGADPTLRIQVHNDLIAWESKRRSDLAQHLEYNRERWHAAAEILKDGIAETQYAERLILGIAKASRLFADSLRAVYDDKLLDDQGNAVKNSFLQNRLAKKRSQFEYSIENVEENSTQAKQSMLLDSIVEAQLDVANAFVDNSTHMEDEIVPEIAEVTAETMHESRKLELIGESIIAELKRSEIEVKNIWDVFDAMVTGDLMEYTVHGSTHGGSSHGGSFHGGSFHSSSLTGNSGSIHGFLTPGGENEAPIVSSVHSPLVKSTFRQLGGVEDGWLIEMYYKSAVAYQRSVFGAAEMELQNLFQEISSLEEKRFRKLHQLMLAFAPRQRRLFNQLPDHLKVVLENLVGLRIDEESLQKMLDESVQDRSRDHLKGSTAHKSSILNRSRVKAQPDAAENEVEDMEANFGSPFASPMILLSKVVELKPSGLKGLVNTAWKPALAVVTSEGNILVFETSEIAKTPTEAFKSLYPPMNFDDPNTWVSGRKADIVKSLTPTVSLKLTRSNLVISPMRKSQLEIVEEKAQAALGGTAKSRFMNAVKSTGQQTKCTLRVPSSTDATDWANLLERTKKVLLSQSGGQSSRFRF
ncbi:MAG: hypothetical protein SGILL_004698 [Bacillariaceae sp.]